MCRDLPDNIRLAPGELTILGETAERIVEALHLLAQALTSDLGNAVDLLQPPTPPVEVEVSELKELFARFKADEQNRKGIS